MKKILCLLLLCLLFVPFSLISCTPGTQDYRDDVPVSDLSSSMIRAIGEETSSFRHPDSDYFDININTEGIGGIETYEICLHTSSGNFSEIGICKVSSDKDADEVNKMLQTYVESQQKKLESFLANYEPEEVEKIQNATVQTFGRYVIYVFLTKDGQRAAFDAVKAKLAK